MGRARIIASIFGSGANAGVVTVTANSSSTLNVASLSVQGVPIFGITNTTATLQSIAIGPSSGAANQISVAIGTSANASGDQSIAVGGSTTTIGNYATAMGPGSSARGNGSIAIGQAVTNGVGSIAIGGFVSFTAQAPTARDTGTIVIGSNTAATNGSIIVGDGGTANVSNAISIGRYTNTSDSSIAMGLRAKALGVNSVAIGTNTYLSYSNSVAIGVNAYSSFTNSISIGANSYTYQYEAIAIGSSAYANAAQSIAIGRQAYAYHSGAVAIGYGAQTSTSYQIKLGSSSHTVRVDGYLDIGGAITANGSQGSSGQVLMSAGAYSNAYWSSAAGGFSNGSSIQVQDIQVIGNYYDANGNGVFQYPDGTPLVSYQTWGGPRWSNDITLTKIAANNSVGTAGQILYSGGSGGSIYWAAAPSGNTGGGGGGGAPSLGTGLQTDEFVANSSPMNASYYITMTMPTYGGEVLLVGYPPYNPMSGPGNWVTSPGFTRILNDTNGQLSYWYKSNNPPSSTVTWEATSMMQNEFYVAYAMASSTKTSQNMFQSGVSINVNGGTGMITLTNMPLFQFNTTFTTPDYLYGFINMPNAEGLESFIPAANVAYRVMTFGSPGQTVTFLLFRVPSSVWAISNSFDLGAVSTMFAQSTPSYYWYCQGAFFGTL